MAEIGEKCFLRGLLPLLHRDDAFVNGFGHDASIVDLGLEQHVAFKIDRAPTPLALRRGWSDYKVWGRLAVVANISDLLAAAAWPRAMMLSLVVPKSFDPAAAADIVAGCEESCVQHGLAFVGGDTKEGPVVQVVGAAIGTVDKCFHLGRQSAVPGDHLVLAGRLGGFAGAISLLDARGPMNEEEKRRLMTILTKPTARIDEGLYFRKRQSARAACDLSDGLADALSIFCGEGVGITLDETDLPLHEYALAAATALDVPGYRFAFSVGDWAIAYVVPASDVCSLVDEAPPGLELFDVGCFDDTGLRRLKTKSGRIEAVPSIINEQFRARLEDDAGYLDELLARGTGLL